MLVEERDQNNSFCLDATVRVCNGRRETSGHGKDKELDAQGPLHALVSQMDHAGTVPSTRN